MNETTFRAYCEAAYHMGRAARAADFTKPWEDKAFNAFLAALKIPSLTDPTIAFSSCFSHGYMGEVFTCPDFLPPL
ncbi:MAG: hypothetical protein E6R03_10495 [Hyphomicrobiaceae bacterium]|nr:MAG: hypothetical protein E6R03_10495 [Hyphomicrobiaceae bacterium]